MHIEIIIIFIHRASQEVLACPGWAPAAALCWIPVSRCWRGIVQHDGRLVVMNDDGNVGSLFLFFDFNYVVIAMYR